MINLKRFAHTLLYTKLDKNPRNVNAEARPQAYVIMATLNPVEKISPKGHTISK